LRQSQACMAAAHTGKAYLPSGAKPAANTDDGIWARYQRSTTRAGRGNKAELNANLMQVGYDKAFARKDGTAYVGIAVDHLNGGSEYQTGSGSASGTSVALYNTWLGNKGHYYDVILRQGHFGEDYHLTDMAGTFSSADYGVNATTLSGEYGYRKNYAGGRYLEPQAEVIYGHLSGADYHTSLGWPVHVDGVNHLITRVGVALGQSTSRGSYYFKTSYYHDFGGTAGSVTFGDYNYSRSALRDWAELTLGGDVRLAKNTQVYGELTKYLGDLTNNLNVNVGVRFSF
jgi:outer membrane autotransporter protein